MALFRFLLPIALSLMLLTACGQSNDASSISDAVPAAQQKRTVSKDWGYLLSDETYNYNSLRSRIQKEQRDGTIAPDEMRLYKRWEGYYHTRTSPNGVQDDRLELFEMADDYLNDRPIMTGEWQQLSPGNSVGAGRVTSVVNDPSDPAIRYACAPAGGLWRQTGDDQPWQPLTDRLPMIGVSCMAVDPNDNSILYIGTGDRDHCDAPGSGLFKSIDNGYSWQEASEGMGRVGVYDLLIDGTSILAATSNGIYRSGDSGATWKRTSVNLAKYYELERHPSNPQIVYACDYNYFWKSSDGGETWQAAGDGLPSKAALRLSLATSAAAPDVVYVGIADWTGEMALFRSADAGQSFIPIVSKALENSYHISAHWYNFAIAASPTEAGQVFVGGNDLRIYNIEGNEAERPEAEPGYTFGPIHGLTFTSGGNVLLATDAGLMERNLRGWSMHNKGLHIEGVYDIAVGGSRDKFYAASDLGLLSMADAGKQPGTSPQAPVTRVVWSNGAYLYSVSHEDGLVAHIRDKQNGSILAELTNSQNMREDYAWAAPIVADKHKPNSVTIGLDRLWNTEIDPENLNEKRFWREMNEHDRPGIARFIKQSSAATELAYAVYDASLDRTASYDKDKAYWAEQYPKLPIKAGLAFLEPHPSIPDLVFIGAQQTYFQSSDQANGWFNYSGGLPDSYVTCLAIEPRPPYGRYIGTEIGIWYKNDELKNWVAFRSGLPANARITDIELTGDGKYVLASTYGRGTWISPVYDNFSSKETIRANYRATRNADANIVGISVFNSNLKSVTAYPIDPATGKKGEATTVSIASGTGTATIDWSADWKAGVWIQFENTNGDVIANVWVE